MNKYPVLMLILSCNALSAMYGFNYDDWLRNAEAANQRRSERMRNADILAQWSTLDRCPEEHQEGIIRGFVATYHSRFSHLEDLVDSKDYFHRGGTLLSKLVSQGRIHTKNDPLYRFFKKLNADTSAVDLKLPKTPEDFPKPPLHNMVRDWLHMYPQSTPYEILEISPSATLDDIKKAYKKLSLQWHPDRHSKGTAEEQDFAKAKFQVIAAANELLTDDDARKSYDTNDQTPEEPSAPPIIIPAGDKEFKPANSTSVLLISTAVTFTGILLAVYYYKQYYKNPLYKAVEQPMDAHV